MSSGEEDAILIEIGRKLSEFTGLQRDRNNGSAQTPGRPYLYNPSLGMMRYEGLSQSKESERLGRWFRVVPDWTTLQRIKTRDPFSNCMMAKVLGEARRAYCETTKTINEEKHRFTYFTGTGIVLDVTEWFMLIWHDKLGLISYFNIELEKKFVQLQVVKFKAESRSESRHCAFHAKSVEPARECRFKRLYCQSDALIKSHRAEADKKKILYAECPNGDRVLLLDAEKRLLRQGNDIGLNAGEKLEVVYYSIYAGDKLVHISGFYFQTDEDCEAKPFWDSQWKRFAETGMATDEDLPECFAESAPSEVELPDEKYTKQWKNHFKFWNPDDENIDWISDAFLVKRYVLGRSSVTNSEVSLLTRSTVTRPSTNPSPAVTPVPNTVSTVSDPQIVEKKSVWEKTEKQPPIFKIPFDLSTTKVEHFEEERRKKTNPMERVAPFDEIYTTPPSEFAKTDIFVDAQNNFVPENRVIGENVKQAPREPKRVEQKKPRLEIPKEKKVPFEIVENVEFEEVLREKSVLRKSERHPFSTVRAEDKTALFKKAISESAQIRFKIVEDQANSPHFKGQSNNNSVQFSDVSIYNLPNASVSNVPGPSSRPPIIVSEPKITPPVEKLPESLPPADFSAFLNDDAFNKHPKSLRLFAKKGDDTVEGYLKKQMALVDTQNSISVRNVLNKVVSTELIMKMIREDDPALAAVLRQMYSYPDYVYIGHLCLLNYNKESCGAAHLDRIYMERLVLRYICDSPVLWETIRRLSPFCESEVGSIEEYLFVDA